MLLIVPGAGDGRRVREWLTAQRNPVLRVTQVDSPDAGVTMLSGSNVDAVLLDWSSDGPCPLESCRRLRAAAPHVPIVLNAPADRNAIAAQALQEGAADYVLEGPSDGRIAASTVCNALRRARSDAELRDEQERHRQLLDLLDDGVASLDANGCFVDANPAMARMLGYDGPYDLRGVPLRDVYAGPGTTAALLERLAGIGILPRAEAELLSVSGARVEVLLRARTLRPRADGSIAQIICTDISTERRLEEEARQAEQLVVGGTLAAGAVAEIERLLTAIAGAHELLGEVIDDQHPRQPELQYLRDTAAHAKALTEELQAATRRRGLRPAVLDADAVLERLYPSLQQSVGGEIAIRVPPNGFATGQVTLAPGALDQVILELASIAREVDPDGAVTLTASPVYLDATYAREHLALIPGHYVVFVITTSTQSLDKVIAPDWESERSFSPDAAEPPTALELATVYRMLNEAGGHFTIRRTPGNGTTFKAYLPRVDTAGQLGTILLVEDEPSIRCGGRQLLELLDYRVLEAADPHEAIWLASRFGGEIDLLIADVVLPGMSGREMAERLIAGGYVSRVLYMSGLLKETLVARATLPPDAMFIEKPFTMAELTARVREIFG